MASKAAWSISQRIFSGKLNEEFFTKLESETNSLQKGEILLKASFISIDPITRLYMSYSLYPGETIPGRQIARVVESRNQNFPKGRFVVGSLGWTTYSVLQPDEVREVCEQEIPIVSDLPFQLDHSGLGKSAALGVLGIPGLIAYISLIHACKVLGGETVVVSSAAGQIGHLVGQIAKILGCNVIGYSGDSDKLSWIKSELGFDWSFNYKTQDVKHTLKVSAPGGVDIFLDGVGGSFHSSILEAMKPRGRICIYGSLSSYENPKFIPLLPATDMAVSLKELSIFGFNVYRYLDKVEEALDQLAEWIRIGALMSHETLCDDFDSIPNVFLKQLSGNYKGKVIVRL